MAAIPRVITYDEWLDMPVAQDGVDEVVKGEYRLMPPEIGRAHVSRFA